MNDLPNPNTLSFTYTTSGIPRIIHQTWETADIPDKWKPAQAEWKRLHPDWAYILWTDAHRRAYIQKYYPEYLELYDSYDYPIQRADMIRYFILYDFGGLYSDLDQYPKKSFEPYLTASMDYFVLSANLNQISIHNGLMITQRHSSIMKKIQEQLKLPVPMWSKLTKHHNVLFSTGPWMVSKVVFNSTAPFVLLPRKLFNPFSIIQRAHIHDDLKETYLETVNADSTWNSWDSTIFNFITKHNNTFSLIGILAVILTLFLLVYYVYSYRKCKRTCASACVVRSPKVGLMEFYRKEPTSGRKRFIP
jgi:mannosyltransferase OCH1-like enzyme